MYTLEFKFFVLTFLNQESKDKLSYLEDSYTHFLRTIMSLELWECGFSFHWVWRRNERLIYVRKLKPEVVRSKSGGVFIKIQYQLNKRKPGEIYVGFRRTRNCRVDCSFFDWCHRIRGESPKALCSIIFSKVSYLYNKVL